LPDRRVHATPLEESDRAPTTISACASFEYSLGMASGIVAGLVAITPAAGHVQPISAILIGGAASVLCYGAVQLKGRLGYDDSLDVFGVHGVGGIWGALATGVFCTIPVKGLLDGNVGQVGLQALGVAAAAIYAFIGTLIIGGALKATMGLRCSDQQERDGLDIMIHGERGYHH